MTNKTGITLYTTKDIQELFKCSKNTAYALMNLRGFPTIRLNAKMLVEESALQNWLTQHSGDCLVLRK